jgi:hypothetical protein
MNKMDFNKQVTIIIGLFILGFFGLLISIIWANADINTTFEIVMDNNTLEAIKSINYTLIK